MAVGQFGHAYRAGDAEPRREFILNPGRPPRVRAAGTAGLPDAVELGRYHDVGDLCGHQTRTACCANRRITSQARAGGAAIPRYLNTPPSGLPRSRRWGLFLDW